MLQSIQPSMNINKRLLSMKQTTIPTRRRQRKRSITTYDVQSIGSGCYNVVLVQLPLLISLKMSLLLLSVKMAPMILILILQQYPKIVVFGTILPSIPITDFRSNRLRINQRSETQRYATIRSLMRFHPPWHSRRRRQLHQRYNVNTYDDDMTMYSTINNSSTNTEPYSQKDTDINNCVSVSSSTAIDPISSSHFPNRNNNSTLLPKSNQAYDKKHGIHNDKDAYDDNEDEYGIINNIGQQDDAIPNVIILPPQSRKQKMVDYPISENDNNIQERKREEENLYIPPKQNKYTNTNQQHQDQYEQHYHHTHQLGQQQQQQKNKNKFWPPWPLNLLQRSASTSLTDPSSTYGMGSSLSYVSHEETRHQKQKLQQEQSIVSSTSSSSSSSSSSPLLNVVTTIWKFTRMNAKVARRNVQDGIVNLWFHLPPAVSPLILLACIPQPSSITASTTTSTADITWIMPILSNAFVRNIILGGIGLAVISWGHAELRSQHVHSKRSMILQLPKKYRDINKAELPPFLPEYIVDPRNTLLLTSASISPSYIDDDDDDDNDITIRQVKTDQKFASTSTDTVIGDGMAGKKSTFLSRFWLKQRRPNDVTKNISAISSRWNTIFSFHRWKAVREIRQRERKNAIRQAIYNDLVQRQQQIKTTAAAALAAKEREHKDSSSSKKSKYSLYTNRLNGQHSNGGGSNDNHTRSNSSLHKNTVDNYNGISNGSYNINNTNTLGYALVTGASRGIGRAIAVELARWEIPLVLVARDTDALTKLATDIEMCYGVPCYVLPADLSIPGIAQQIYSTTKDANIRIDFLINNAGISTYNELSVNIPLDRINQMIQLNAVSVTELTQLYGHDMKDNRRGRILMMSSVSGAVNGIASVAVYAATKAYENSYAYSLSKELEPYGVRVTCCQPGAVQDTSFKHNSHVDNALCWKVPYYAKTPYYVAKLCVRGMLRGDAEVTPGILNRLFLKVVRPIVPSRIHNLIAEMFWSPFHLPFFDDIPTTTITTGASSVTIRTKDANNSDMNKRMATQQLTAIEPATSIAADTPTTITTTTTISPAVTIDIVAADVVDESRLNESRPMEQANPEKVPILMMTP